MSLKVGCGTGAVYSLTWLKSLQIREKLASVNEMSRMRAIRSKALEEPNTQAKLYTESVGMIMTPFFSKKETA